MRRAAGAGDVLDDAVHAVRIDVHHGHLGALRARSATRRHAPCPRPPPWGAGGCLRLRVPAHPPYYLQRMDRTFERGRYAAGFKIQLKPSEYSRSCSRTSSAARVSGARPGGVVSLAVEKLSSRADPP